MTPAERQAKFYAAHPDRRAMYSARYYATHKAEVRARNAAWRSANPEKVKATSDAWRAAHPENVKATRRRSYVAHPLEHAIRHADGQGRRRTLREGGKVFRISAHDWRRLVVRRVCAYCGSTTERAVDHVVPITRGGHHSIGNLVSVCGPCNRSKGTRFLSEWRYRDRLRAA